MEISVGFSTEVSWAGRHT